MPGLSYWICDEIGTTPGPYARLRPKSTDREQFFPSVGAFYFRAFARRQVLSRVAEGTGLVCSDGDSSFTRLCIGCGTARTAVELSIAGECSPCPMTLCDRCLRAREPSGCSLTGQKLTSCCHGCICAKHACGSCDREAGPPPPHL